MFVIWQITMCKSLKVHAKIQTFTQRWKKWNYETSTCHAQEKKGGQCTCYRDPIWWSRGAKGLRYNMGGCRDLLTLEKFADIRDRGHGRAGPHGGPHWYVFDNRGGGSKGSGECSNVAWKNNQHKLWTSWKTKTFMKTPFLSFYSQERHLTHSFHAEFCKRLA